MIEISCYIEFVNTELFVNKASMLRKPVHHVEINYLHGWLMFEFDKHLHLLRLREVPMRSVLLESKPCT